MNDTDIQEVAQSITKKKRTRPDLSEAQSVHATPEENASNLRHIMKLSAFDRVDMSDADAVRDRVTKYFDLCIEDGQKPSLTGLALILGEYNRTYMWEIREGKKGKNPETADILKKASSMLEAALVNYMQNGQLNPVPALFMLKNYYAWADKQEVVVTPQSPMGDTKDTKALEAEYVDSVVTDPKD